jgi:hypothetical protein
MKCITCQQETSNPKFCSRSCAATYNNTGVRRHGEEPGNCIYCGQKKSGSDRKYCSQLCSSNAKLISPEQKRASNAARQSKYRAKKYRVLAENADIQKIKAIYSNCPHDHEVDHIIPLSKGGTHHEDNLQYLPKLVNRQKGNRLL